jgi:hypothetical protein
MHPQPLIAVRDIPVSSRWYQRLLKCHSGHGGTEYEQLIAGTGAVILQLHHWDAHEHPYLGDPEKKPYGNEVLLWFQVADFNDAISRANPMSAQVLEGPKVNPNANHREIWIRDPDGYVGCCSCERIRRRHMSPPNKQMQPTATRYVCGSLRGYAAPAAGDL